MTEALTTELDLADIRERDALWTANYAHMHSSDGYGPAAADRRKLLGEIERLRRDQPVFEDLARSASSQLDEIERLRRLVLPVDDCAFTFPKAWAPYLRAVILGSLSDFDSDCRWHLNELAKKLGAFDVECKPK